MPNKKLSFMLLACVFMLVTASTALAETVKPVASFTANVTEGPVPLSVNFTDTSTESPTSWAWNFGDNSIESTQNPTAHTYSIAGTYTVRLVASNGLESEPVTKTINVWKATPSITWNDPVNITTNTPLSNTQLNALASVSGNYTYTPTVGTLLSNGTHTLHVDFVPDDAVNFNVTSKDVTINVTDTLPDVDFEANVTTGVTPLAVKFSDKSINSTTWAWDFGDNTTSTEQNPEHVYATVGSYDVTLTTNNTSHATKEGYITVTEAPVANNTNNTSTPTLAVNDFTANVTTGKAPLVVGFTSNVTGANISSWKWTFKSQTNTSFCTIPRETHHLFVTPGLYDVTLTVKDASGQNATLTKTAYINVTDKASTGTGGSGSVCPTKPTACSRSNYLATGYAPMKVTFKPTATPRKITSYKWNFGDGTGSTAKSPTHCYKKAGTFTVTLTMKGDHGYCVYKKLGSVKVNAAKCSSTCKR
jgi:PKD repeat protein